MPADDRCTATTIDRATQNETRCIRSAGHVGEHEDGCLIWRDRPAPSPDRARFEALLVAYENAIDAEMRATSGPEHARRVTVAVSARDALMAEVDSLLSRIAEARAAVNEQGDYLHDADGDLARAVRMLGGDLRFNIEKRTAAEAERAAWEKGVRDANRIAQEHGDRADRAEARAEGIERCLRAIANDGCGITNGEGTCRELGDDPSDWCWSCVAAAEVEAADRAALGTGDETKTTGGAQP